MARSEKILLCHLFSRCCHVVIMECMMQNVLSWWSLYCLH